MKKSYLKVGIIGVITFTIASLIKGVLDELNASTFMYSLVLIPISIDFIYSYKHFSNIIKNNSFKE